MVTHSPVLVFGAGGYARCVIDAVEALGAVVEAVVDRDPPSGATCAGHPVWSESQVLEGRGVSAGCVALGDNAKREDLVARIRASRPDFVFPVIVHPRATIARSSHLGEGSVVLAGAVINPHAVLGLHVSIYSNAVVEHDCALQDFVTLAPAAALGGGVRLGARVFVGMGSIVSHGVAIGDDTVVGAGAAVTKDQPGSCVLVGVPARQARTRSRGEHYL